MPKLIIKRETPQRLTRQTILFWLLGLLPIALLAGFLTGQLVNQLQQGQLQAGHTPLLPLAPALPPSNLITDPPSRLPLPSLEQPAEPFTTPPLAADRNPDPSDPIPNPIQEALPQVRPQPLEKKSTVNTTPISARHPPAKPAQTDKPSPRVINPSNTKDQPNNRNRPANTPSPRHKPVKSPSTVKPSRHSSSPVTNPRPTARALKPLKPQAARSTTAGSHDDYRLLEQSLGIPLQ